MTQKIVTAVFCLAIALVTAHARAGASCENKAGDWATALHVHPAVPRQRLVVFSILPDQVPNTFICSFA